MSEVVEFTRQLVGQNTVNPPGNEALCIDLIAARLERAGFVISRKEIAPTRPSIVARFGGHGAAIALTGHVDVVPLGESPWQKSPFGGDIDDGKLYGRGTTDMKGAVASMVIAAERAARENPEGRPIELAITASEETDLEGARSLRDAGLLGEAGLLIIGEPTSNQPAFGHRGIYWFDVHFAGKTAHGSRPELGHNAILDAATAAHTLTNWSIDGGTHPVMGRSTVNVSRIKGGQNINSVPDLATITLDFRLLPGVDHHWIISEIKRLTGAREVDVLQASEGFWSDPDGQTLTNLRDFWGMHEVVAAPYGTDGSHLVPGYGNVPTVIIGPGEMAQAHQTDEWCSIDLLEQSVELYRETIQAWRQERI